jgi:hypothetical protein
MSEFIAACPKCNHQILCDTDYVGKRVACPVCFQEIIMPAFLQPSARHAPPQNHTAPPSPKAAVQGKPNSLILGVIIGATVLVLAVMGAIFAFHKSPQTAAAAPATTPSPAIAPPQPTANLQLADSSNCLTNHYTLETPTFIIKITEVREKNALNCLDATYEGVSKTRGRRIVVKGADTFSSSADGSPSRFLGWTFANASTIYFVSMAGDLKVTQGASVLVSEKGEWKEKPKGPQVD